MSEQTYVAFLAGRLIKSGPITDVLAAVKLAVAEEQVQQVLFFNNCSGQQVDFDMRGSLDQVLARINSKGLASRGRPRLGVESREVGLLPRHWEWLEKHSGGVSSTLRKIVEAEMKSDSDRFRRDAIYKIMSAMAGNERNFEDAARALYAGDDDKFVKLIKIWPADLRNHLTGLLQA